MIRQPHKNCLFAGLACLLWVCAASQALAATVAGKVIALHGSARAELSGQQRVLEPAAFVHVGETLTTDSDSKLQIRFADNTILGLGPRATVRLDAYVFEQGRQGSLALHFAQGVARVVSGKIVEQNPEGFKLSSPLAHIGIRGTTTLHAVSPTAETHAVEFLTPGHTVVLTGPDGNSVRLDKSMTAVDLRPSLPTPKTPRALTPAERDRFQMETIADRFQELAAQGAINKEERGFVRVNPQTESDCRNTQLAVPERLSSNRHDQESIAGQLGITISTGYLGNPQHAATLGSLVSAGQLTRETIQTLEQANTAAGAQMTAIEEAAQGGAGGGGY